MSEVSQAPVEKEDQVVIRQERLTRELETLKERVASVEKSVEQVLMILQKSEQLFELRASRVLHNIFSGLTHNLEHSIEEAQQELRIDTQGFDIQVVNGTTVKENANTIQVVKREDGGYDFSAASNPDVVHNEQTETFCQYFDKNPEVFGDKTVILVNIIVAQPPEAKA